MTNKSRSNPTRYLTTLGLLIVLLFGSLCFSGCSSSTGASSSSSSYSSKEDAAREEASHYHYDKNGHIYRDNK